MFIFFILRSLLSCFEIGNKIPAIENFGVLRDKYDSIDLSDNEIRKFDNFPMMLRATSFLLNNNLISKVGESIGMPAPHAPTHLYI